MQQVFEQAASPALRPFIKRFLVVEFPFLYADMHLPDTNPVAAFTLRGGVRVDGHLCAPPAAFTGPRVTLRTHEHRNNHAVLLAIFTPVGAAAFLKVRLEELAGTTAANLSDILDRPADLNRLHEELAGAQSQGQRVQQLENFLLARIRVSAPDPLVAAAVAWIEQNTGGKRIAELAGHIGLSQSALERRFRRIVGISPKTFASVVRLRRAVRLRKAGDDLTSVAHAAGYFDQSHFIKDFRRATGSSPEEFFRRTPVE